MSNGASAGTGLLLGRGDPGVVSHNVAMLSRNCLVAECIGNRDRVYSMVVLLVVGKMAAAPPFCNRRSSDVAVAGLGRSEPELSLWVSNAVQWG